MDNKTFEELEDEAFRLYSKKEFTSARKLFQELCVSSSEPHRVYTMKFNIASCLASETKYKSALETLAELEVAGNEDVGLVYIKSLCLYHMNKLELALQRLSKISADDLMLTFGGGQNGEFFRQLLQLLANIANEGSGHLSASGHKSLERIFLKLRKIIGSQFGDADEADRMWQKNFAHVLFRSDSQYEKCTQLYQGLQTSSELLNIEPEILSNLCVAYILTGRNRDAEQLIKQVEEVEEGTEVEEREFPIAAATNTKLHSNGRGAQLTRINLAVGTLYCVKNNYQFGLRRILDSLEPVEEKLTSFNWFQVKRCLMSLLDKYTGQQVELTDELFDEIYKFLIHCEAHGHEVSSRVGAGNHNDSIMTLDVRHSVAYEAKYLRTIMEKLVGGEF